MDTLALEVKHLTLAWIKAYVGTEGNEQADQAAKEGAAGGSHMTYADYAYKLMKLFII